jgi:hypothetical protein
MRGGEPSLKQAGGGGPALRSSAASSGSFASASGLSSSGAWRPGAPGSASAASAGDVPLPAPPGLRTCAARRRSPLCPLTPGRAWQGGSPRRASTPALLWYHTARLQAGGRAAGARRERAVRQRCAHALRARRAAAPLAAQDARAPRIALQRACRLLLARVPHVQPHSSHGRL